jgi:prevent-host-death family protein
MVRPPRTSDDPQGTQISQRTLRNQSAEVMNRVEAGEEFVIARDGRPVARLVPLSGPRTVVPTRELLAAFTHVPPGKATELRAEMDGFFGDGGDRIG